MCNDIAIVTRCLLADLVMMTVNQRVAKLREQLSQATATKRLIVSHAKRLGTVSDTQMLRDQLNGRVSQLKQHLEQGAQAASAASESILQDDSLIDTQKATHVTTVQQMERQLMSVANEYPGLVRSIAAKQQEAPPRTPGQRKRSTRCVEPSQDHHCLDASSPSLLCQH